MTATQAQLERRAEGLGLFTIFVWPHTEEEREQLEVFLDVVEDHPPKKNHALPMRARSHVYHGAELPHGVRHIVKRSMADEFSVLSDNDPTYVKHLSARRSIEIGDPGSLLIVPVHQSGVFTRGQVQRAWTAPDTVRTTGFGVPPEWHIVSGDGVWSLASWERREDAIDAARDALDLDDEGGIHGPGWCRCPCARCPQHRGMWG